MSRHILFAISPHGYGHAAMAAPVINQLAALHPQWCFSVRTTLSAAFLHSRIHVPFLLQSAADDFGMVQRNALEVDVDASAALYQQLHGNWAAAVERVAAELTGAAVDLVVADVPYLTLAAAQQAGIANVALCCLHWGDIYGHYCLDRPEGGVIHAEIMAAYNGADYFIRTEPAMPMSGLNNLCSVGPLASRGTNRRDELAQRLRLAPAESLVLVAMGGIDFRLPMEQWPAMDGMRFLVPHAWQVQRDDAIALESLAMPFSDLLASCDLLLTKPGYGSFSEAALNGTPVLYVPRDDWPESPWLIRWLEQHGRCAPIPRGALERGELAAASALLQQGRAQPLAANGVMESVAIIESLL